MESIRLRDLTCFSVSNFTVFLLIAKRSIYVYSYVAVDSSRGVECVKKLCKLLVKRPSHLFLHEVFTETCSVRVSKQSNATLTSTNFRFAIRVHKLATMQRVENRQVTQEKREERVVQREATIREHEKLKWVKKLIWDDRKKLSFKH